MRAPLLALTALLLACGKGGEDTSSQAVDAPDEPGPWSVGHATDVLANVGEEGRDLPLDIWYPVTPGDEADSEPTEYPLEAGINLPSELAFEGPPGAGSAAPLLIFSHGYQGINTQSVSLMEALASHGFAVIAPGHTGNTQDAPDDDFETAASRRVPDVVATLAWAASAPVLDGQIDGETIGVLGHSFGGMTTLGAGAGWAGAAPIDGVDALMPISAVVDAEMQEDDRPYESAGFSQEQLAAITQPTLLLGGTEDASVPVENNGLAFEWMTGAAWVARVDILGANHTHFANVCDIGDLLIELGFDVDSWPLLGAEALLDPYNATCTEDAFPIDEAVRLQNLYAVAFFRRYLMGDTAYDAWLTPEAADDEPAVELWVR